jgi:hypothetical protein
MILTPLKVRTTWQLAKNLLWSHSKNSTIQRGTFPDMQFRLNLTQDDYFQIYKVNFDLGAPVSIEHALFTVKEACLSSFESIDYLYGKK